MIASFIITFRETLEAALVIGIILSFLTKIKQTKYNKVVYAGIIAGLIASLVGALLFINLAGGFTGKAEQIFGGITILIGAILLTTMILWMMKQRHISSEIENKIAKKVLEVHKLGLFFLVFISILKEGIETVIFLEAVSFVSQDNNLLGAITGIIVAIFLGYLIFLSSVKINIKKFFTITSIILILFAAGLFVNGVHEFEEAGIIPSLVERVWDINPDALQAAEGIYPLLHEDGHIGSIFKGLFGYNGSPSLIEVLVYVSYLLFVFILWKKVNENLKKVSN